METSSDELAIRALIARYCDAVNRYDGEAWARGEWLIQERRYHELYEVPTDKREQHWPYPG